MPGSADEAGAAGAEYRPLLFSIAYGMTGSVGSAEDVAEDVVQDAFLGLTRARQAGTTITDPKAYLTTVVSRLGINYLRSARVRRETYVGDWLPEPVVVPAGGAPKIPPACAPSGDARPRRRFVASLPETSPATVRPPCYRARTWRPAEEITVKQIRIQKLRARREHPGREVLPRDARDPDVVRVKALARSRLTGSSRSHRTQ